MNRREAKRLACRIAAGVLYNRLDLDGSNEEVDGLVPGSVDLDRLDDAIRQLAAELDDRGAGRTTPRRTG